MTKAELVSTIADKTKTTKAAAEKAVNAFLETITDTLKAGDKITFTGFGTFETANRAARKGKNPQTGAPLDIPAARTAKFKPGKTLKDAVNI